MNSLPLNAISMYKVNLKYLARGVDHDYYSGTSFLGARLEGC